MQYSSKLAVLAALAAPLVSSQSLSNLPPCAQNPAIASISSTGCALTDIACICSNKAFLSSLQPVIEKSCSAADLASALTFAQTLCASAGITLSISAPAATSTTSAAMSTSAAAETTSAAEMTSTEAAGTDTAASESMTSATMTTMSTAATTAAVVTVISDGQPQAPTGVSNTTSNITTASSTPVPFMGAAASYGTQFMSAAMLIGAVGVFFTL